MANCVVLGGQWGDEGKGKIIDALGADVDWVIRYQGGANAGHTIDFDGREHVLHLVPSGVFHPRVRCFLGNGMVVDPWELRDEILALEERGLQVRGRLFVSAAAHLILPYHKRFDELREAKLRRRSIGTTGRGIGPAYIDKAQRTGLRMGDLLLPKENLERRAIEKLLDANEVLSEIYQGDPLPAQALAEELVVLGRTLAPLIVSGHEALAGIRRGEESALFEGAQGTLLDYDHGTYPYVTSSNCSVGGAVTGTGLPPRCLGEARAVFKAYCTRVGNGPFPTELLASEAECLRKLGGEYGATTGRPRRCGWFDLVAGRYAVDLNGLGGVYVTKLDVLDSQAQIKVATAYDLDGQRTAVFPLRGDTLARCKPVYETLPGWEKPTGECRALADLPPAARRYLEFLEEGLGTRILGVSVGRSRAATVWTPGGVRG